MQDKAQVYAKSKYVRTSVKKAKPVANLIRGKKTTVAEEILKFNNTKAATLFLKTLKSAVANARHNLKLSEKDLYISEIYVNKGSVAKTGRWVGRGHFSPILKKRSHLVVGLSENKPKEPVKKTPKAEKNIEKKKEAPKKSKSQEK